MRSIDVSSVTLELFSMIMNSVETWTARNGTLNSKLVESFSGQTFNQSYSSRVEIC